MNDVQYAVAMKVAYCANQKDHRCSIDPATLLIIANIMVNVVRLLYVCFFTEDAVAKTVKNPGRIQKYLLYREVKKNFPSEKRKTIYESLLSVCEDLSDEELKGLITIA